MVNDDIYARFREEFAGMEQHPGIVLDLSGYQAWCLLGQIQLACRHPENVGPSRQIVEGLARTIEAEVATTPALQEVARRGWLAEYDEEDDK